MAPYKIRIDYLKLLWLLIKFMDRTSSPTVCSLSKVSRQGPILARLAMVLVIWQSSGKPSTKFPLGGLVRCHSPSHLFLFCSSRDSSGLRPGEKSFKKQPSRIIWNIIEAVFLITSPHLLSAPYEYTWYSWQCFLWLLLLIIEPNIDNFIISGWCSTILSGPTLGFLYYCTRITLQGKTLLPYDSQNSCS